MKTLPRRETANLAEFPDLVVIYLGMEARSLRGLMTLLSFGREIMQAVNEEPAGLLCHEWITYSLIPPHRGMRQYWSDFDALERWARSLPHREWWQAYVRDTRGTGFWHEAYSMREGMEAVYLEMEPLGFLRFAPREPARGSMFSSRSRLGVGGEATKDAPVTEEELQDR